MSIPLFSIYVCLVTVSLCTQQSALNVYISNSAIIPPHLLLLQSGEDHKVTQFQMSCWTPEGLCTSPPAIMAVIEQVLVVQRRTGNRPIVVHGR